MAAPGSRRRKCAGRADRDGVDPAVRRTFLAARGSASGWQDLRRRSDADPASVVLSYRAWQRLFDSRSDIVGRTLWVADRSYTVIGVMPERFWFGDMDAPVWTALDTAALAPEDSLTCS